MTDQIRFENETPFDTRGVKVNNDIVSQVTKIVSNLRLSLEWRNIHCDPLVAEGES